MKGNFKVYKSSAGSGKTYTLVKEFLRLCLLNKDLYAFSRILAITFTNKATFEMKQRILLALKQIANKDDKISGLAESLATETGLEIADIQQRCGQIVTAILHAYADFSISTIDKFTHRLVRTFAKDLGISPTFKVELDTDVILNEVIDLLIDKLGVDDELTKLVIQFALARIENEKAWKIDKELFQFAKEFFQEQSFPYLKEIRGLSAQDFNETIKNYQKEKNRFESKIKGIGNKAIQLITDKGIDPDSFFNRKAIYVFFLRYKDFKVGQLVPSSTALKAVENDKWHATKCTPDQAALIDSIKEELELLFNEGVAYHDNGIKKYLAIAEVSKNLHSLSLLNHIEKRLLEFKKEEKLLSISDFNQLISGIVENEPMPFIYERLGDKYKHIMIDEFQDTSVLQFSNLLPLVENSLAQGNENLVVGDAKQAIYRFRGGEVEQFSELPYFNLPEVQQNDLYSERMQTLSFQYEKTVLDFNYRSKSEVVEFNNSFFEFVKNDETLTPKIKNIFEGHRQKTLESKKGGYVEISFVEGNNKEDRITEYNKRILSTIHTCLENGYSLKDIAVLVRKTADGREVAECLKKNGINILSSEALLLKNDESVLFVIRLAQLIFNPDAHLYQKSVIEFLSAKGYIPRKVHENYQVYIGKKGIQLILDQAGVELNVEELKLKSSHEFFEAIYRAFNFTGTYHVYLQFLQDIIFDYFKSTMGTIPSFLDFWEENQNRFSISSNNEVDAVSIMTIHKSKGLEFPICIVPFAEQEIKHSSHFRKNAVWTQTPESPVTALPYALVEFNNNLKDSELQEAYRTELAKSQIDFLCDNYVAFTRAVEAMFIITCESKPTKSATNPELLKLPQLLAAFVSSNANMLDNKEVKFGSFERSKNKAQIKEEEKFTLSYLSADWKSKIKISSSSQAEWKNNEPIQYGVVMHDILSEIDHVGDVREVLERQAKEGLLSILEYEHIEKKLDKLLQKENIIPFFDQKYKVKQEASMLSNQGKLLRPDRVVFWEDKLAILDFKTGEKNDAHHEQMREYQAVLEDISQQKVEAYLLYTETEELVKV